MEVCPLPFQNCQQIPHKGYVTISGHSDRKFLIHSVSGEVQQVSTTTKLYFDADGWAYVSSGAGAVRWARDIFQKSVWRCDKTQNLFVTPVSAGKPKPGQWLSRLQSMWHSRFLSWSLHGQSLGNALFYNHAGGYVFFEPRPVMTALGRPGGSWIKDQVRRVWKRILDKHSLPTDDHCLRAPGNIPTLNGLSAAALLCVVAHDARGKSQSSESVCEVIDAILVATQVSALDVSIGNFLIRVESGVVDIPSLRSSDAWRQLSFALRRAFDFNEKVSLSKLLVNLAGRPRWLWLFQPLLLRVATAAEQNIHAGCVKTAASSSVAPSHKAGARLSPHERRALAIQQLRRVKTRVKVRGEKRRMESDQVAQPGAKRRRIGQTWADDRLIRSECALYLNALQAEFAGACHISLNADATRLGGRKTLFSAVMNLASGVTAWSPPKVPAQLAACLQVD